MIEGMKYYKLDEAVKAAETRTRGTGHTLYIYSAPSINGLFVDWILTGLKYSQAPNVTVTNGKATYKGD